jgi:hypothetical protein
MGSSMEASECLGGSRGVGQIQLVSVVYAILVNYIPVIATSLQLTKSSKLLMVS